MIYACELFWLIPRVKSRGSKGNADACFATQPSAELLQSIQLEVLQSIQLESTVRILEGRNLDPREFSEPGTFKKDSPEKNADEWYHRK